MTESKIRDDRSTVTPDLLLLYRRISLGLKASSAIALAAALFAVVVSFLDAVAQPIAFVVFYIVVIFVAANTGQKRWIVRAATSYDITGRRYADRDLSRSEARYQDLFRTTAMAIWECDFSLVRRRIDELPDNEAIDFRGYLAKNPDFVREAIDLTIPRDANGACVKLFGAETKDELLAAFGRVWPAYGEVAYTESMIAAVEGRQSFECEAVMQTINGKRLAVLFTIAFPPKGVSRENIFMVVADMTATTEAQEALYETQANLAYATRLTSLGELTASIAHEVNQPLAGIVSNGQAGLRWLLRDAPDLAATRTSLERVVEEGKRAAAVIRGIRALTRNDPPQRSLLDINEIIEECVGLLSQEIKVVEIDLMMSLSPDLRKVLADRVQVQQVLINLLLNAIQAMKEIEDWPRLLTVKTWAGVSGLTVAIKDSGTGIDPKIRERLFSAFVTNKSDGMGIGLSVCRSIIERNGGRIWADGNDGPGAVFYFSLPLLESLPHVQ